MDEHEFEPSFNTSRMTLYREEEPSEEPAGNPVIFVLWGILVPVVSTCGLVGNVLTMVVLCRKEMLFTAAHVYLRALVVSDIGILLYCVNAYTPVGCAHYFHTEALVYYMFSVYPLIFTPLYYIGMTFQQCNVWITVAVCSERYISICHPFRALRFCTRQKATFVVIAIVVVSFVFNTPHLLATHAVECPLMDLNLTSPSEHLINDNLDPSSTTVSLAPTVDDDPPFTCLTVVDTEFGKDATYKYFKSVAYGAIVHMIPLTSLVIFVYLITKELLRMRRRQTFCAAREEEANLSLVMVLIVTVFIVTQTPALIIKLTKSTRESDNMKAVSNFLFVVNSSVNFIIYTAFGRKFRGGLLTMFRRIHSSRITRFTFRNSWSLATNDVAEKTSARERETVKIDVRTETEKSVNWKAAECEAHA